MTRTVHPTPAGAEDQDTAGNIVTLRLDLKGARRLQKATDEMPYLLHHAASVFQLLSRMTSSGFVPDESDLCGLYDLCGRGLAAAADNEGEALAQFDVTLRSVLARHVEGVAP